MAQTTLFFQFFRELKDKGSEVTVELKNDICLKGRIAEVDQFLNLKLDNVSVSDPDRYPQLLAIKSTFIRGSVLRYVHLNPADVNVNQLQAKSAEEALNAKREMVEAMKKAAA